MAAAIHCGIFFVPVNWHLSVDELAFVLADSRGRPADRQPLRRYAARALQRTPAAGAKLRACVVLAPDGPAGFTDFEALWRRSTTIPNPTANRWRPDVLHRAPPAGRRACSRTGATQPIAALQAMATNSRPTCSCRRHDGCAPYPLAQYAWSFQPLLAGLRVVMCQRFDAAQTLKLIDEHRVTNVHLVPTQFIRLLRLDEAAKRAFGGRSLVRVWHGAAPCSPQVKRDMIDWWGPCIHEYYGSTEGGVVSGIGSQEWLQRPSVGPHGQTEVCILRDDGSEAPAGEQGTIYLRSRTGARLEYHNDPAKTAAAHHGDAWFTTGDVGWIDAEGYIHLTDRRIDMIISGGVNIYPAEIEAVLAAHPAVQDVAVIGVPHAEFGAEVKAIVQPVPGVAPDEALRESLTARRGALTGHKLPKSIEVRSGARTETGSCRSGCA